MLRIPVCMHNVEDDKMFRPASWNAFRKLSKPCSQNLPVYKFLKEPLVRKFGEEWYKAVSYTHL